MKYALFLLILFLTIKPVIAVDFHKEIDLAGEWLFEIGDDMAYMQPGYDASKWERINVPSFWENEGFPGYDGYAWYRIKVNIPSKFAKQQLFLKLARIDDIDETYLNGVKIGNTGIFPPNYETAWNIKRIYPINNKIIHFDQDNVIAVRVYDRQLGGGIVDGDVGIYSRTDILNLKIDLAGDWKFRPGDDKAFAQSDYIDDKWNAIHAPAYWEERGYPDLDGIAWYRKTTKIPKKLAASKLILMLGQIDDADEVYFNSVIIGHTGAFSEADKYDLKKHASLEERAYFIPPYLIKPDKNVIAIRVMDAGNQGGIYNGYIGITTRDEYMKYSKRKKK
ncbi:beta galactosidase jelly roll domain-containing protein [candidate division KSB1 bacterium]|nr:beta galactosidase jelly roll domain-containing protein [candidate division KSB1 bacterium]